MPERETPVVDRDLSREPSDATLPIDAGLGVPIEVAEPVGADEEGTVKKRLGWSAWLAAAWIALLVAACALAPVLPIPGPRERVSGLALVGPFKDMAHPLGGDNLSHDMLSQLIYGARNSLFIGFGSIILGILIGGFLGLVAGYYRGRLDSVIVGAMDVMLSIPALVLALALTIFLKDRVEGVVGSKETAGRYTLTLALGIIAIPTLARITRANALVWSQREFVTAARAQGARNWRIMFREVLPNVVPAMAAIALLGIAIVVIAEASISILGAGIERPAPTWGNIIFGGVRFLTNQQAPFIVFESSFFIFTTVLSLNYLGDAVRARFDVREGRL